MSAPKNILITGATAGIGRQIAIDLAKKGHRVFATGRREDALASLAEELDGFAIDTLRLDVTDSAAIAQVRDEVERRTDGHGVDVLINNAGYGQVGPVELVSDADVRKQYDTNVFGLLEVTRAFLPKMRTRGAGRILNISSVGGRATMPLMGVYGSTKYALEALSDALRIEVAAFGVQVVLIEPGYIKTEFGDVSLESAGRYSGESPYAAIMARTEAVNEQMLKFASTPDVISRAVQQAIGARRPKARYVAPFTGKVMIALFSVFPTRVVDWVFRQALGLTPRRLLESGETVSSATR